VELHVHAPVRLHKLRDYLSERTFFLLLPDYRGQGVESAIKYPLFSLYPHPVVKLESGDQIMVV
jgi:hypothetical protein